MQLRLFPSWMPVLPNFCPFVYKTKYNKLLNYLEHGTPLVCYASTSSARSRFFFQIGLLRFDKKISISDNWASALINSLSARKPTKVLPSWCLYTLKMKMQELKVHNNRTWKNKERFLIRFVKMIHIFSDKNSKLVLFTD